MITLLSPGLLTIGWREWVALPELGIRSIKAKIDTGAKTSALHAFDIELFTRRGVDFVSFKIHPLQRNRYYTVVSEARLVGNRRVKSSGGHESDRPVIKTRVCIGPHSIIAELTLAGRDAMGFRMLLGRDAIKHRFLIDANRSFLIGKRRRSGVK